MGVHDPFKRGALAVVDPDRDPPPRLEEAGEFEERPARVGGVVQDAERIDLVERPRGERRPEQVGLRDRDGGEVGREVAGRLDRAAQVDTDDRAAPSSAATRR